MKKGFFIFLGLVITVLVIYFINSDLETLNISNKSSKEKNEQKISQQNTKEKIDVFSSDFEVQISNHDFEIEKIEEKVKEFIVRVINKDFDDKYVKENFHVTYLELEKNRKKLDGGPAEFYIDRLGRVAEPETLSDIIIFRTNFIRDAFVDYGEINALELNNFREVSFPVIGLSEEEEQKLIKENAEVYINNEGDVLEKGFIVKVTLFFENGEDYSFEIGYAGFESPEISSFVYQVHQK